MDVHLKQMNLNNYRNFKQLELIFNNSLVVILGENGSGKTSILEAISLLGPGRGFRGAKYNEICHDREEEWSTSIRLQSKIGTAMINSNFHRNQNIRKVEYNGAKISASQLPALVNIIWLIPQMDGIFLSASSERRRFLDRIVYNFYQEHASNINKYTHLASERLRILVRKHLSQDEEWLNVLEQKIAEVALKINKLRADAVMHLQRAIQNIDTPFPKAGLSICSVLEPGLSEDEFIRIYSINMAKNRQKDTITRQTNFGVNKIELVVEHAAKKRPARFCSTGEQKALLISIMLGQIEAARKVTRASPILLLDELFVHLDDYHKDSLAQYIINSKLQTFITATDLTGLKKLSGIAQIINI